MDLLAYFRVLRRHWLLIVVATLLGAALGSASTLLDRESSSERARYRATATLVFDTSPADGSPRRHYSNPNQIAILTTTGDVPDNVAKKLGTTVPSRVLAARIITTTNAASATLDITAIDPDPQRATTLANTFASELVTALNAKELEAFTVDVNTLTDRLDTLQKSRDTLLAQLTANPTDQFVRAQYDAAASNFSNTYQQYLRTNSLGAPSAAVSPLEQAEAVPIESSLYDDLLNRGVTGQNHFQGGVSDNTYVAPASGSSFNDPVSRGVLGGLLGLLAGVGLALLAHKLDRRVRTRDEVEAAFELPVLAEVPRLTSAQQRQHDIVANSAPLSRAAEAYRAARTSLLFQQAAAHAAERGPTAPTATNGAGSAPERNDVGSDSLFEPDQQGPLVLMVTSASPGEGKTTTSANLASVFGEAGASVLMLNCDFRRPSIHEMFGVADEPRRVQGTTVPGVKVVTNVLVDPGSNPAQVVAAQRQVIAAARSRFDVIILDTAPLLTANDAVEVVSSADLVLLVARPGLTTMDTAQRSMDLLNRLDAPLAGVVLVATSEVPNDYYYYYQRGRVPEGMGRRRAARAARSNGKAGRPAVDASIDAATANAIFGQPETTDEPQAP
jgi:Mrp family chromosome partitioning ATPase